MNKTKLIIASNNKHKVEEISHFIGENFELCTLAEIGFEGDIDETGTTLAENSLIKAKFIYEKYQMDCLADDSGLEVFSLKNDPGVYSARYAGPQRNDVDNYMLLLKNLKDESNRKAQFRTVITLIINGKIHQFEGTVLGEINFAPKGKQGFGYDPVFVPEAMNKTFAELSLKEKNTLSHRTRALRKMVDFLK